MDLIKHVEATQMKKEVPVFKAGDTVRVNVKIVEIIGGEMKERTRPQAFEGVVIKVKNAGASSTFTVRKMSNGVGVERIFPLYSPRLDSIEVLDRGRVRRAKLYYLRKLRGKAARIRSLGHK